MPRDSAITVHVEPATKAALEKLAHQDGRTVSRFVERLLLSYINSSVADQQRSNPVDRTTKEI